MTLLRLTEVEPGRWAWLREAAPEPPHPVPEGPPTSEWCPLRKRGCPGECQGDLCMAAREDRAGR